MDKVFPTELMLCYVRLSCDIFHQNDNGSYYIIETLLMRGGVFIGFKIYCRSK